MKRLFSRVLARIRRKPATPSVVAPAKFSWLSVLRRAVPSWVKRKNNP